MRRKHFTKQFLITFLILSSTLNAQVTIGSDAIPRAGSLLDLKENADGSSTKGFGMPRVAINSLTDIQASIPSVMAGEESAHTGLMVYNVREDLCAKTPITKGLYVWNGSTWLNLGSQESPDVTTYRDQDGNDFKARRFGNAGIWMIENLAAKTYASGMGGGNIPVHTGSTASTIETCAYPQPSGNYTDWGTAPLTWDKKQGLLYSWRAAAKGNNSTANQGQGEAGETVGVIIQGVCPDGWHLPSDREWNELEKEIYNNAGAYSGSSTPSFNPTSWNLAWETGTVQGGDGGSGARGSTPGHSSAMKSGCPPTNSTTKTNGTSKSAAQGGFESILTGFLDGNKMQVYGGNAYYWSSSSSETSGGTNAYHRSLYYDNGKVQRDPIRRFYLCAVRCKKN